MSPLYRNDRPGDFPDSWYTATTDLPPPRPPLRGEVRADVAVVGAGYTGLSAALHLAERGYDVAVIEAHRAGFGASGRNGGQVGSGFNTDQTWLARKLGPARARALWDLAEEAKALTRDLAARHVPEARYIPGILHGKWTDKGVRAAHDYARELRQDYGYRTELLDSEAFHAICPSPVYRGGVLDMGAGHLHPLRYAVGLARAAEAKGAKIHELSEVVEVSRGTARAAQGVVRAQHIILAGNGYLSPLNARYAARVMPINSFIAASEPLGPQAAEILTRDVAVADDKFVVNYFRLSEDRRLLFGGRENYSIAFPGDIPTALKARMERLFPQIRGIGIDYYWGGTLGITMTRLPLIRRVAPGVLAAGGFSGHGLALATLAGKVMAEAIAGQAERFDILSALPVPPFPGGAAARAPLLALAMTWFSLRDRLGL